ncbi:hypothetical protein LAZ67_X003861 [Cordylochernes scorpioides]|uniref:Flavin-containing monooxygenase n=1 Tax=Cordylochernes scorpioides TaxID=51811 RepID=A0ABY6LUG5_9ARAC|nr:hypothetical protein LAZ67_X003861 [Cordylochernes scorpioides]
MYQNLRTNLPKEVMMFPDFPFPEEGPSFIHHTEVLKYLHQYADYFQLYKYIKFNTEVCKVTPKENIWTVHLKENDANNVEKRNFDFIIVCNGHYSIPHWPMIPGLSEFPGQKLHSHDYRNNSHFEGQEVVVVGAGPSGIDIAIEIAQVAKKLVEVYGEKCMDIKNVRKWCREFNEGRINVHDEQRSGRPSLPESTVARIDEMVRANRRITLEEIEDGLNEDCSHFSVHKIESETLGYRKVILSHNKVLSSPFPSNLYLESELDCIKDNVVYFKNGNSHYADSILVCTGYQYDFPFLDPSCRIKIRDTNIVWPLYKHIINVFHPTMAFIGIPSQIPPFPFFYQQIKFFLSAIEEKMILPQESEMLQDIDDNINYLLNSGLPEHHAHKMPSPILWEYDDDISKMASIKPISQKVRELYEITSALRKKYLLSYKDHNFNE